MEVRILDPLGEQTRVRARRPDLGLEPEGFELPLVVVESRGHVGVALLVRADAGDLEELDQLVHEAVLVLGEVFEDRVEFHEYSTIGRAGSERVPPSYADWALRTIALLGIPLPARA